MIQFEYEVKLSFLEILWYPNFRKLTLWRCTCNDLCKSMQTFEKENKRDVN